MKEKSEGAIVVDGNGREQKKNRLSYPCGLALDSQSILYVADGSGNDRIEKFERETDKNGLNNDSS